MQIVSFQNRVKRNGWMGKPEKVREWLEDEMRFPVDRWKELDVYQYMVGYHPFKEDWQWLRDV